MIAVWLSGLLQQLHMQWKERVRTMVADVFLQMFTLTACRMYSTIPVPTIGNQIISIIFNLDRQQTKSVRC